MKLPWGSASTSCFAEGRDPHERYAHIDLISRNYTGWSLQDIKRLTVSERRFFVKLIEYRVNQRERLRSNHGGE